MFRNMIDREWMGKFPLGAVLVGRGVRHNPSPHALASACQMDSFSIPVASSTMWSDTGAGTEYMSAKSPVENTNRALIYNKSRLVVPGEFRSRGASRRVETRAEVKV